MGKHKDKSDKNDHRCGSCRNFDPDKKGGYCRRRDKKRSADDDICGHHSPR